MIEDFALHSRRCTPPFPEEGDSRLEAGKLFVVGFP